MSHDFCESLCGARGECAAADLNEHVVACLVFGVPSVEDFVCECFAAFDGEPVVGSLACERDGAVGDGFERAEVAWVTQFAFASLADVQVCAERFESFDDAGFGVGWDEDFELCACGFADDGGG